MSELKIMKGLKRLLNDKTLGYDPANAESIEQYAVQLENKTFFEVVQEKGI